MARIAREQEKLARIPATKASSCIVEALGREFRPLLEVADAYAGEAGNFGRIADARREAIMEAAPAFKADSALGALFQLMVVAYGIQTLSDHVAPTNETKREEDKLTACLHSVAEFIETHFGVNREEVGADYAMSARFSPFRISKMPPPEQQDTAA